MLARHRFQKIKSIVGDERDLDINPGKKFGLLRIVALCGHYQLPMETRPLWQEIAGEFISGIGLLGVFIRWRKERCESLTFPNTATFPQTTAQ